MKIHKVGLRFAGVSSLVLLASSFANAADPATAKKDMTMSDMDHSSMDMSDMDHSKMDMSGMGMSDMDHSKMDMSGMDMSDMDHSGMDMSGMDHGSMDMSGMDHGSMDMSGMDHGSMDMSGMQGGKAPADARSPDYSNGVPYGRFGKPVMMGSLPLWGVSVDDLGYQFDDDQINYEFDTWYGTDSNRVTLRSEGSIQTKDDK